MPLPAGARLGPYEIVAPIGAGGMGEVCRARDTKLDRDVAIKVLPADLAMDRERLARFEREAKLLASLNHPNIAHVYGFESAALPDGATAHFLAMELVEGEDLSARLTRGALPLDEALPLAIQIVEGLEQAHEHGIIHRDLKPANVKVTPDGKVKVLDFGLAKAMEQGGASGSNPNVSHSPTMSRHMTEAGMIMGTAAYMSPEQARGKSVDRRADIWSFGVVLFEMLSGDRLFAGDTVSDVLAAVLRQDIDWTKLPSTTPPCVRELLRRCLSKDLRERLQAMGEARITLAHADDPGGASGTYPADSPLTPVPRGLRDASGWAWGAAGLMLIGWAATAVVLTQRASSTPTDLRASLTLPTGLGIATYQYAGGSQSLATLAVSPRGDSVGFAGWKDGEGALYLRRFDGYDSTRLTKTEQATAPFFSPDGTRLGFFARGRLWRIDLPGGVPVDLAPAANSAEGGASAEVFDSSADGVLVAYDAWAGGGRRWSRWRQARAVPKRGVLPWIQGTILIRRRPARR